MQADSHTGDPHERWYRFDGRQIGYVGNNGTTNTDYTSSIAARTTPSGGTGAFAGGATYGAVYADFDQDYDAINTFQQGSGAQGSTGGQYSVRQGDTLAGIAAQLWGDASLSAGSTLTLPSGVLKSGNTAATTRPYDPSDAYGDTSPTTPQPQAAAHHGGGCGVLGQILTVIVAVIATHFLGPLLGDVVTQGFGNLIGTRKGFDFKELAIAVVTTNITQGIGEFAGSLGKAGGALGKIGTFLGDSGFVSGAVRGVIGAGLTQGIAVATGLQSKFDFVGVAAAGIGSGVAGALDGHLNGLGKLGQTLVVNTASGLANASTRSVLNGTDFGDNIIAALPDIIGNTIGGFIAGKVAGSGQRGSRAAMPDDTPPSVLYDGELLPASSTNVADMVPTIAGADDIVVTGSRHRDWSPAQWSSYSAKQAAREKAEQGPSNTLADHYYVDDHRSASTLNELSQWRSDYEALVKKNGPFSDTDQTRAAFAANEQEILNGMALATELVDKPIALALGGVVVTAATAGTGTVAAGLSRPYRMGRVRRWSRHRWSGSRQWRTVLSSAGRPTKLVRQLCCCPLKA